MVQTIGRCHVPVLRNAKALALWGNKWKSEILARLAMEFPDYHLES